MERLSVFKALADGSRYSIYLEVARSSYSLSTTEIADRLDLHPSTVRLHLERLREAGLLEVSTERQGLVGRPQHRWSLASEAPALGLAPSGFRLLTQLLADAAARAALPAEVLLEIGSHQGRRRGATLGTHGPAGPVTPAPATGTVSAAVPTAAGGSGTPGAPSAGQAGSPAAAPDTAGEEVFRAVMDHFDELGFDPSLEPDGVVAFADCPFREIAALYPDLVCQLHRGVAQGVVDEVVQRHLGLRAEITSFSSLVDEDPCRFTVRVEPASRVPSVTARR